MSDQKRIVVTDDGTQYELQEHVAYRGKKGCRDPRCTQRGDLHGFCFGWHCPRCDEPTNMYGHHTCKAAA